MTALDPLARSLVDRWQRDFPLVPRPFRDMARSHGTGEDDVIAALQQLAEREALSRVGAVLTPNTAGASTLAAMKVPSGRLEAVAALVSEEAGVNHNYEREHALNLWFVVTGSDAPSVARTLGRIGARTGLPVLDLPLERSYFIDLGFPLERRGDWKRRLGRSGEAQRRPCGISAEERSLLTAIEAGLPLIPSPFAVVARGLGTSEESVLAMLASLLARGVISRFGLIVRHRVLGFQANAMAVWNIPDEDVDRVGACFAALPFVTLCYRRPRRLPVWDYNLFCMVHGRERAEVETLVAGMSETAGVSAAPHTILFSGRCFKQRGATLSAA